MTHERGKTRVVIIGGGFAGLTVAKKLGNKKNIEVILIDRRNYHLFQPLLYQVAMAGLSPAEIAAPIRSILSSYKNIQVIQSTVEKINHQENEVSTTVGSISYDYLVSACGSTHSYFGKNEWAHIAPGLKTIKNATDIRTRVLSAFENAEVSKSVEEQRNLLTFVIVGGGPTGVELAGAIGEMSRYTLAKDFRNIDLTHTRIILIEGGKRILPTFSECLSNKAMRDLESLGVQVWVSSLVTNITDTYVQVKNEKIESSTILWAAGVKASAINEYLPGEKHRSGKIFVEPNLSLKDAPNIFVIGDQAIINDKNGNPLPGTAPVAMQQGRYIGKHILEKVKNPEFDSTFKFLDKGQMATIGRKRAVCEFGYIKLSGFIAWIFWIVVHIYFLTGFKNRFFVVYQWVWAYLTFKRGARLIVEKN